MSNSKQEQEVVRHFTHIHPSKKIEGNDEFTCDGCKSYGYGKTYDCAICNYKLHDHCATCPPNLISFMHPLHELRLVYIRPELTQQNKHMCDICNESVEGLYYQCKACGFYVHPLCTRLPHHVKYEPHPAHLLELSLCGASNTCMVCHSEIQSWRYKCGPCELDIHMECVSSFISTDEAAGTQQSGFESQPKPPNVNQGQAQKPIKGKKRYYILAPLKTISIVSGFFFSPAAIIAEMVFS